MIATQASKVFNLNMHELSREVFDDRSESRGRDELGKEAGRVLDIVGADTLAITPEQARNNSILFRYRVWAIDDLGFEAATELKAQGVTIEGWDPQPEPEGDTYTMLDDPEEDRCVL